MLRLDSNKENSINMETKKTGMSNIILLVAASSRYENYAPHVCDSCAWSSDCRTGCGGYCGND